MTRGKKELAEQIIPYATSVEVEVGRGKTVAESVKKIGVTDQTYPRWKAYADADPSWTSSLGSASRFSSP